MAVAGGDPVTIWALDALAPYSLALSAVPRAALLLEASAVLLGARALPAWVAWSGYAIAALSLVGSAMPVAPALFPLLGLSTLLFELWVIALALGLLRVSRGPEASGT